MTQDETWLLHEKYDGEKIEGFFADCTRLSNGEPLAYIIGWTPFLHTKIFLDSKPLIPRTETEFWVEQVMQKIKPRAKVLDLCAGSGCIGVAVAYAIPNIEVDFAELDTKHHATIQKNIQENNIDSKRTHIFGGDLFAEVTDTYDFILTNPPYIDPILDRATESVKNFEPRLALYGGMSGMECIVKILESASSKLTPNGTLVIEHEPEQITEIHRHAAQNGFFPSSFPDQFGVMRYTICVRTP